MPILKDHLAQSQEVQSWKLVENRTLNEEAKYPYKGPSALIAIGKSPWNLTFLLQGSVIHLKKQSDLFL